MVKSYLHGVKNVRNGIKLFFSFFLGETHKLEKLGLSSNGLGPEGARLLALAISDGFCNKLK